MQRLIGLAALSLAACATVPPSPATAPSTQGSQPVVQQRIPPAPVPASFEFVTEHKGKPFLDFKTSAKAKGDLNFSANGVPFGTVIGDLAKRGGYSVATAGTVDFKRKVSLEFLNATLEQAIRETAYSVGYVALFDKTKRTITLATEGSVTFKLPPGLAGKSNSRINFEATRFSIGLDAGNDAESVTKLIADVAGKNASIHATADGGLVSVRANAQALHRVSELVKALSKDASVQVAMDVTVLEVKPNNGRGLDWARILGTPKAAPSSGEGGWKAAYTSANAKTIALAEAVASQGRIESVSRQRLTTLNHVAAGTSSRDKTALELFIKPDVSSNGTLQITVAPSMGQKQESAMTVAIENGKTAILSGLQAIGQGETMEYVALITAQASDGPEYDPVISETP